MSTLTYFARFEKEYTENGKRWIVGVVPQLGVSSFGRTYMSAFRMVRDALQVYIDGSREIGNSTPPPEYLDKAVPITVEVPE